MRKSEFLKVFREKYHDQVGFHPSAQAELAVVMAYESSGAPWDPEEEPLPEEVCWRLESSGVGTIRALPKQGKSQPLSPAAATEVVRRYNTWPKLRAEIKRIRPYAGAHAAPDRLLAILDGKEGS